METLSFEAALQQLEETVGRLESGQLTLEEALAVYERGQKLAAYCAQQLETARLKVDILAAGGEIVTLLDDDNPND